MSSSNPEPDRARLRVGLTGATSQFGSEIARHLLSGGAEIVGLDDRAGTMAGVEWRPVDLASPSVVPALEDVDVLIHLAGETDLASALAEQPAARRARQVGTARTLTTAAATVGVRHLLVVTSAMVFGARPGNPSPIREDSPLRADDREGLVADLVAVEHELGLVSADHPELQVTIVRPAALVGPGVDTMITRHFEAPRLLTIRGTSPAWAFCHVEDLASALLVAARAGADLPPVICAAAPGHLTQAEVEEHSGMRHIDLSEQAAFSAADRLYRLGVVPVPASDLAYVAHPWLCEPKALTDLGWTPVHDNADCLDVLLEGVHGHRAVMARRLGSWDALGAAAAGAASAAVAAVATAALVRRRRGRA